MLTSDRKAAQATRAAHDRPGTTMPSASLMTAIHDFAPLLMLLLLIGIMGQYGLAITRLLFVVGCLGVAIRAYQRGGFALHVQTAIPLFVFAPLLRRIVDLHTGYDASGSMLVGPLLALTAVFPALSRLMSRDATPSSTLAPFGIAALCLVYGWMITAFNDDFVASTTSAMKYVIPMLYCLCLILIPEETAGVLGAAAKVFLVISPIMGLYGILQHLNPQPWDRYWMISSKIDSIGLPEPGKVRVFGTMNSPVSFAAYATCGLLLFTFVRSKFIPPILVPIVAILPLSVALLLSGVRTAWISAIISILVCLCFGKTRKLAVILLLCLVGGVAFALLFTSFGDVIASRLTSLGSKVSSDGSGAARLDDYFHVFGGDARYIFGVGLAGRTDSKMNALDGLLLSSAVQMGIVFGILHTAAVLWAGVRAACCVSHNTDVMRLVTCALLTGSMAVFLLTNISVGEIGFLYWMMVGALTAKVSTATSHPFRAAHPQSAYHTQVSRTKSLVETRYPIQQLSSAQQLRARPHRS